MTKLRFDSLSTGQFASFKLVPKKKQPKINSDKKLTKLVRGICLIIDGEYKIQLDIKTLKPEIIDKGYPDILVLDFTEESYNIKDVTCIFTRKPDKDGRYTRYIRNESKAKFDYGDKDRYVPFCRNWVCSGYIIRRNGKLMFDFNECIAPQGYIVMGQLEDE